MDRTLQARFKWSTNIFYNIIQDAKSPNVVAIRLHWCAHIVSKKITGILKAYDLSCKLFDLVNASSRFKTLFKECQCQTSKVQAWKGGESVALSHRTMYRGRHIEV